MNVRELALVSALQAVFDVADGEEHPKLQSIAAFARRVLEGPGALEADDAPRAPRLPTPAPTPSDGSKSPSKATLRWRKWDAKRRGQGVGEGVGLGGSNALDGVGSGVGEALANAATNASGSLFSSLSPLGSDEKASENTRETEASEKENQGVQDKTDAAPAQPANASPNAQPTPTQRRQPTGDHQRVLAAFAEEYELCRKTKPVIDGKQAAAAKRLLSGRTTGEAVAIVRRAFTDPFVAEKKPDLAYIASNVNAYRGEQPEVASGVHRVGPEALRRRAEPPPEPPPYTPQPQVNALVKAAIADMDAVGKDKTNGRR